MIDRNEVEPFTLDEVKAEQGKPELDGPLIDYAAKGTKVQRVGVEAVNGHDAYKLKPTTSNRARRRWHCSIRSGPEQGKALSS